MKVVLQVISGASQGRKIPLQSGERARFGSSDIADVCFPHDPEMAGVHFEVECLTDGCLLRHLSGAGETQLNDQSVDESALVDGDEILAGQTRLQALLQGGRVADVVTEPDSDVEPTPPKLSAAEICQLASLSDASLALLQPSYSPEEFAQVLTDQGQYSDALRVLSLFLSKRQAIFWACQGVEQVCTHEMNAREKSALDATMNWLNDPSDANRRAAMAIAEEMNFENAAAHVAAAAFWSEGSITAVDLPEVPPDPKLCGKMVAVAMVMTATDGDTALIKDRYQRLLEIGRDVLDESLMPPEQSSV